MIGKKSIFLMAIMVVLSVFAPTAMAVTYDSTNSTISDGDTLTIDTSDSESNETIQADDLTSDAELRVKHNETGDVMKTFNNPTEIDSANGTYAFEFTHADLEGVELKDGQAIDYDFILVDDATLDETNQTTHTLNVSLKGQNTTHLHLQDGDFTNESDGLVFDKTVTSFGLEVPTNGSTTDISIDTGVESSTYTDSLGLSDRESGAALPVASMQVDGEDYPVYVGSAPDSVEESDTYGVVSTSGDEVDVHLGDEFEDRENVYVQFSDDSPGVSTVFSLYGLSGITALAKGLVPLAVGGSGAMFAGLFVIGRRRTAV